MSVAPTRDLTVVFDVAGVLLEWDSSVVYDDLFANSSRSKKEFFSRILDDQAQQAMSAGEPMREVLDHCAREHPGWEHEIFAWIDRWDEMLVGEIGGTRAVLEELQERGYRTCLLGNWAREEFERALKRFEFLSRMENILLSGDCGILKPDPRIFELAENRFGLVPEKTVFIDDRNDNVQAALERGWNGIVFESPRQLYLVLMENGIL